MDDLIKELDFEYSVEREYSNEYYLDNDKRSKTLSRSLKIFRSVSATSKNLKWLRKNGYLNRWNYFNASVFKIASKNLALAEFISVIATISCGLASSMLFFFLAKNIVASPLVPFFTLLFAPFLALRFISLFDHMTNDFNKTLSKKFPKEKFNETRHITVPWENKIIYEFFDNIKEYDFTDSEMRQLFDLGSSKIHSINEQISKLMEIKSKLPDDLDNARELSLFRDADKMLQELLKLRETEISGEKLNQVEEIFKNNKERKNIEEIGVSVAELSEVSEFLADMKANEESDDLSAVREALFQAEEKEEALSNKNIRSYHLGL